MGRAEVWQFGTDRCGLFLRAGIAHQRLARLAQDVEAARCAPDLAVENDAAQNSVDKARVAAEEVEADEE